MTDAPTPGVPKPIVEMHIPPAILAEALTYWMNQTQRHPERPAEVDVLSFRIIDSYGKDQGKLHALGLTFTLADQQPIPFPGSTIRSTTVPIGAGRRSGYCDHGVPLKAHCDECAPPFSKGREPA